jgi:hypothetical protein
MNDCLVVTRSANWQISTLRFRQVFWLSDLPSGTPFPSHLLILRDSGIRQPSSPITAAGPSPNFTVFPFHDDVWIYLSQPHQPESDFDWLVCIAGERQVVNTVVTGQPHLGHLLWSATIALKLDQACR